MTRLNWAAVASGGNNIANTKNKNSNNNNNKAKNNKNKNKGTITANSSFTNVTGVNTQSSLNTSVSNNNSDPKTNSNIKDNMIGDSNNVTENNTAPYNKTEVRSYLHDNYQYYLKNNSPSIVTFNENFIHNSSSISGVTNGMNQDGNKNILSSVDNNDWDTATNNKKKRNRNKKYHILSNVYKELK